MLFILKSKPGAINVLNNYPTVKTLDRGKFWRLLWQYTAIHTPLWKVVNDTDGTFIDIAKLCGKSGQHFKQGSVPQSQVTCKAGTDGSKPNCICKWLPNGTKDFWIAESGCADVGNASKVIHSRIPAVNSLNNLCRLICVISGVDPRVI